uniref:Uncharacterized protein n=1 Tax=Panagrolaimus sp. ES5 TaxID=591445 RepID=A0AC34F7E2_9BILA
MGRTKQTARKGKQKGDTKVGATKKVGQLMAEHENIEGQATPPELVVTAEDEGREDQPIAAEMELVQDEDDEPPLKKGRGRQPAAKKVDKSPSKEPESSEEEKKPAAKKGRGRQPVAKKATKEAEEESQEDEEEKPKVKKGRGRPAAAKKA